ncbi:MAG: hypothetical protein IH627_24090 [Rubrivivax sp.]|nr:hypothetical protein [Rubrivivax sp.]
MTAVGETDAKVFPARFALLAMTRLGEREAVEALIDAVAEGIGERRSRAG